MIDDPEKTEPEGVFAKIVDRLLERHLSEHRAWIEAENSKIQRKLNQIGASQLAYESRTRELERKVANLEEIVFSEDLTKVLAFVRESQRPSNGPQGGEVA